MKNSKNNVTYYLILLCISLFIAIWIYYFVQPLKQDQTNELNKIWNVNWLSIDTNNNTNTKNEDTKNEEKDSIQVLNDTDEWTKEVLKTNWEKIVENRVDSIHDLSFNAKEQKEVWVWLIATNDDWYLMENFDDFDYDKDWNLPSVSHRIKIWTELYKWYQPYTLDLSKKIDKRIYQAIQFIHEWFKKRIVNSDNLSKKFTYTVYKKDNLFKVVVWWVTEEEADTYFYLWKIEFDYIHLNDDFFWWYIDDEWIQERHYWTTVNWKWENIIYEEPKYTDSKETLKKKMSDFLYSVIVNDSDIQRWNDIRIDIDLKKTYKEWEYELKCFWWDIEDLTYWFKVNTQDMCMVFKNKQLQWYSNRMDY